MNGIVDVLSDVHRRLPPPLAALMSIALCVIGAALLVGVILLAWGIVVVIEWLGQSKTVIGCVAVFALVWGIIWDDIAMNRKK